MEPLGLGIDVFIILFVYDHQKLEAGDTMISMHTQAAMPCSGLATAPLVAGVPPALEIPSAVLAFCDEHSAP